MQVLNDDDTWNNLRNVDYISIIIEYYMESNGIIYRILFPYRTKIKTIIDSESYKGEKGCKLGFIAGISDRYRAERENCRYDRVDKFEGKTFDDENAENLARALQSHVKQP